MILKQLRHILSIAILLEMLGVMLAYGITTVRDPGSETEAAVTLRSMIAEGKVTGPSLLTAGRIVNASSFNPEPFAPVKDEAAIRQEIRPEPVRAGLLAGAPRSEINCGDLNGRGPGEAPRKRRSHADRDAHEILG